MKQDENLEQEVNLLAMVWKSLYSSQTVVDNPTWIDGVCSFKTRGESLHVKVYEISGNS